MNSSSPHFAQMIVIESIIALLANVAFFWIKMILRRNGHEVSFFYGHFSDLIAMVRLSFLNKRYDYFLLVLFLLALIAAFIYSTSIILQYP
jgi:hypothetical protein